MENRRDCQAKVSFFLGVLGFSADYDYFSGDATAESVPLIPFSAF
jgi:hypothetical protein